MSNRIRRHHSPSAGIAVTTDLTTTAEIDLTAVAGGCVLIPLGSSINMLTYYGALAPGADYVAIQDGNGNAVTQSVAGGQGLPLPQACSGYGALKLVGDSAGTVDLSLKG